MTLTEEQRGTAAFDLEKARAMICHYRIENPGDADTDCGLEDLIRQANLAEEALDEIERLRAEISEQKGMIWKTRQVEKEQAARIKELKADLEQSERVVEARLDVIDQQAAKIRELEDAHKRSGAKYAKIINELRSSVYANIPGLKKQWDEILNAPANGKIGPDADAKPHCWQITEERKAAIDRGMRFLAWSNAKTNDPGTEIDLAVLRAMLTEAGQE